MNRTVTTRRLIVALAAAGLTLTACGSDDKSASTTTAPAAPTTAAASTTTAAAPVTTTAAPSSTATTTAASDDYCDAAMAINTAATAAGDPDQDPVAFAKALIGPAQAAAAVAPAAIADVYGTATSAMQAVIDGDSSKFDALDAAGTQIDDFNAANCPWTKVPVTMEDFHFTGVPATLAAGDYTFELSNAGKELHVMVIVRRKPGVTESFEELLNDPAGESKVDTIVANGAPPGGTASAVGHLDAGEYLVLCPIPLGTDGQTEGTGPPHFTAGMHQTLTVTA